MRTDDYSVARRRMVEEQVTAGGIRDARVLAALRQVPRHLFVPRLLQHRAYRPCALPIGHGQTISQPFTVALMTALLELDGSELVLEIGTGSGYQAAVLSGLADSIVTLERVVPLAERAARALADLHCQTVEVRAADGSRGSDDGPFDRILVTACADVCPEDLLRQVAEGGLLLVPLRGEDDRQIMYRYRRRAGRIQTERSVECSFVPLLEGLEAAAAGGST